MYPEVFRGVNRRERRKIYRPWLNSIDLKKRILEIGPLAYPNIKKGAGKNVFYADIRCTEAIKELYKNVLNVSSDEIIDIDFVVGDGTYTDCFKDIEKFDYIIATHVLEHIPQLLLFFQDIPNILNDKGQLCLAIPDKRYCFDHFRYPTSFAECYDIFAREVKNSPARVLDQFMSRVTNDSAYWWDTQNGFEQIVHNPVNFQSVKECYDCALDGTYFDVHYSVFTPETFLILLYDMLNSSMLSFKCVEFHPTEYYSNEFNCVLQLELNLLTDSIERKREKENLILLLSKHSDSNLCHSRNSDASSNYAIELAAIKNSRTYRLANVFKRIATFIMPTGSMRRKLFESTWERDG